MFDDEEYFVWVPRAPDVGQMAGMRPHSATWPGLQVVLEHRKHVDAALTGDMANHLASLTIVRVLGVSIEAGHTPIVRFEEERVDVLVASSMTSVRMWVFMPLEGLSFDSGVFETIGVPVVHISRN